MDKLYRPILCCLAMLSVSACDSFERTAYGMLYPKVSQENMVEADQSVTPMPVLEASNNQAPHNSVLTDSSSVEIFDMELNPDYRRGVDTSVEIAPMMNQSMGGAPIESVMSYDGGFQTAADSSVTIYGLDGDAMSYGGVYGAGRSSVYGQNYGQGYGQVAGQIFFKHGSSRLGSGDIRKISNMAEQAKFAPVNYITVEGFASKPTQAGTDTTQAHIINLRQSMKRSEKVSKALVQKGVPGEKIKTVSWGASKASGNNSQDRRVDVVIGEK